MASRELEDPQLPGPPSGIEATRPRLGETSKGHFESIRPVGDPEKGA